MLVFGFGLGLDGLLGLGLVRLGFGFGFGLVSVGLVRLGTILVVVLVFGLFGLLFGRSLGLG